MYVLTVENSTSFNNEGFWCTHASVAHIRKTKYLPGYSMYVCIYC